MSIHVTSTVLRTYIPTLPKGILVSIADCADDNGFAFPSLRVIRFKSSVKKTALTYHLKALESLNLISRTQREVDGQKRKISTSYQININELNKYFADFRNKSEAELKKLEETISDFESIYQDEYQKARKYTKKSSQCEQLKSQCEQPKNVQKSQCEQPKNICVNNLNHNSSSSLLSEEREEEERRIENLDKNLDDFIDFLEKEKKTKIKSRDGFKYTIKKKLYANDDYQMEKYSEFLMEKEKAFEKLLEFIGKNFIRNEIEYVISNFTLSDNSESIILHTYKANDEDKKIKEIELPNKPNEAFTFLENEISKHQQQKDFKKLFEFIGKKFMFEDIEYTISNFTLSDDSQLIIMSTYESDDEEKKIQEIDLPNKPNKAFIFLENEIKKLEETKKCKNQQ